MPKPEERTGKYMYCIIRSARTSQFTCLGIGERGDVVHAIPFMEIAAVVSDSPSDGI